jgi:hypothetical protein
MFSLGPTRVARHAFGHAYFEGFQNLLQGLPGRQVSRVPRLGTGRELEILLHLLMVFFLVPLVTSRFQTAMKDKKNSLAPLDWCLRLFGAWIVFVVLVAVDSIARPQHLEMILYFLDLLAILFWIFKDTVSDTYAFFFRK